VSHERPDALLKSALEKIVYFEARAAQLSNDLAQAAAERERLKGELAQASQREIELRRVIAELEVRTQRAHSEREEAATVAEALRRERAELLGKILDASRINGEASDFDLASFISELRSEVILRRGASEAPVPVLVAAPPVEAERPSAPASLSYVTAQAERLGAQGRLTVSVAELATLERANPFPGRAEETLFGFSVRELSAPDASARVRAAERLAALGAPAAAPALATALHAETEARVKVALLEALSLLAKAEAVPVVVPQLSAPSPDVRMTALKALLRLDPTQAGPHLAAAVKDPDAAVRRRASLLALSLEGPAALELGETAIRDSNADVRSLAALVLGASGVESARPWLMTAMRDPEQRVRRSASQALSRLLGQDVSRLVDLDDAQRRREVRRLAQVPSNPVKAKLVASWPTARAVAAPGARSECQGPASVQPEGQAGGAGGSSAPAGGVRVSAPQPGLQAGGLGLPSAPAAGLAGGVAALPPPRIVQDVAAAQRPAGEVVCSRAPGVAQAGGPASSAAPLVAQSAGVAQRPVGEGAFPVATDVTLAARSAAGRSEVESALVGAHGAGAVALHAEQAVPLGHGAVVERAAVAPGAASPWAAPVSGSVRTLTAPAPSSSEGGAAKASRVAVVVLEAQPMDETELCAGVLSELRAAIRGQSADALASSLKASPDAVRAACGALMSQGQVVRRGLKYFVA
jgi:HEAT repeat protein